MTTITKTIYLHMVSTPGEAPHFVVNDSNMDTIDSYSIADMQTVSFELPDPKQVRERSIAELETQRDKARAESAVTITDIDNAIANLLGAKYEEN